MNFHRIGFRVWLVYLLIDFGQLHRIIPGMSHLMLGALATVVLFVMVLLEAPRALNAPGGGWFRPVVAWRILFLCAIATGLLLAVTQGRALLVLKTEAPRFVAAFVGALLFIRRVDDLRVLHTAFLGLAFALSGWVLAHHGHGPGLYVDENDAALVLVMLLPFPFLGIFADGGGTTRRLASVLVFTLTLTAIGITLSRGGMVGAMPALLFCWVKSRHKAVSLALGGAALALAVVFAPANFKKEFASIGDTHESTAEARRYYWDLSTQMFPKRPIFGAGAGCWGNALYSGLFTLPDRRAHMTPHSIYFQCWTELGLFGMFCWIGFLAATFRELRSIRKSRMRAGAAMALGSDPDPRILGRLKGDMDFLGSFGPCVAIAIIGYLVCGAFLSVLYYPGLALFAALAQATAAVWRRELLLATLQAAPAAEPAPVHSVIPMHVPRSRATGSRADWNRLSGAALPGGTAA